MEDRTEVAVAHDIIIRWPELDITVGASLAFEGNPALVEEFERELPIHILQSHPTVSGSSVTMWLPYVSTAPTPTLERIDAAPHGRIRLGQASGSKISIHYGPGLEPAEQAVLGRVTEADHGKLADVGRKVWDNTFWRKQRLTVEFLPADGRAAVRAQVVGDGLIEELRRAADAIQTEEPDDLRRIRSGERTDIGSFGQYFSVWDAAHGFVRSYVTNTLDVLYRLSLHEEPCEVARLYGLFGARYHGPLRNHGWETLAGYGRRVGEALNESTDPAISQALLEQLLRYGIAAFAWSHESFPWYLGMHFPTTGPGTVGGVWRGPGSEALA